MNNVFSNHKQIKNYVLSTTEVAARGGVHLQRMGTSNINLRCALSLQIVMRNKNPTQISMNKNKTRIMVQITKRKVSKVTVNNYALRGTLANMHTL